MKKMKDIESIERNEQDVEVELHGIRYVGEPSCYGHPGVEPWIEFDCATLTGTDAEVELTPDEQRRAVQVMMQGL
jgi:hypothetical protein